MRGGYTVTIPEEAITDQISYTGFTPLQIERMQDMYETLRYGY